MRTPPWISLLVIAAAAAAPACHAQGTLAGRVRVTATASPSSLPADGKSKSRIRVELRGPGDRLMPTGTAVFCHADGGLLSTDGTDRRQSLTASSTGGYATVYCTSEAPGPVKLTFRVQDSRFELTLMFYPEGESAEAAARVIHIRGGWVGYCPELNLVRARDGARVQIGGLVFDAGDGLELSMDQQTVKGWGVRATRKGETLKGEDFYYELPGSQGIVRRFGDGGIEWIAVGAYGFRPAGRERELPEDAFRPAEDDEGLTWLVCKSLSYFVGQKVVLRHASLYAQGQRVFGFPPLWVVGLSGYSGASNTQVLGLSTEGGVAVDFPLFYRVTNKWAGSLRIQRGAAGASFVARDGWSLGLGEEYDTGNVKGAVEAGGLFSSDWGLEWRDERQVLGGNQAYLNVGWPDHRNLFSDASMYHYSDTYRFGLRGQFDNPETKDASYALVGDWLTEPRPFSRAADYRLGLSLGGRYSPDKTKHILQNELYGALDFRPWDVGSRGTLTASLSNTYAWDTDSYESNSVRGDLRYAREYGAATRLGADYSLLMRNGDASRSGAAHILGLDFSTARGSKWSGYLSGSWDLTADETYGLLSVDYYLKPQWRLGLVGTHYDFEDATYDDLELEVGRSLGNREIGLRYSVEAGRVSLELGGLGMIGP